MDRGGDAPLTVRSPRGKRALDLLLTVPALLLLTPLLALLALLVRLTSPGPALFRQERMGRGGIPFRLYKFRTMRVGAAENGALVTGRGDPRITRLGAWLRGTKLDELPQLWNVFRGQMSLVGPRPEVPRYVAHYTPAQRRVLEVRPGITDPATLQFRDEETLLARYPPEEREFRYLQEVLPRKLDLNLRYLERASLRSDLAVLIRTLVALAGSPEKPRPPAG